MPKFSQASLSELNTCRVELINVMNDAINIVDFSVLEGHRNQDMQDDDFANGRTKLKWPNGKHNATPSNAVDIAPVYYENGATKIDWKDLVAFGRLMGVVQACAHARGYVLRFGLDWDGDFRSVGQDDSEWFMDAPHVEFVGTIKEVKS